MVKNGKESVHNARRHRFNGRHICQMVKNLPTMPEDTDSIPGMERPPGEGNGYPFESSCLENSMDRGNWWAIVHEVAKSWT